MLLTDSNPESSLSYFDKEMENGHQTINYLTNYKFNYDKERTLWKVNYSICRNYFASCFPRQEMYYICTLERDNTTDDTLANSSAFNHNLQNESQKIFGSSQLLTYNDEESTSHTHQQQTTKQVTTVTKVVREVKHYRPNSQILDYVAMPFDGQHCGSETQGLDYIAMPVELHTRPQCLNYNHIENTRSQPLQHIYVTDTGQYNPHYQDYDNYPPSSHYANSAGSHSAGGSAGLYISEYGSNERAGTPQSPGNTNGSPSSLPPLSTHNQQHPAVPAVAFIQAKQFDEYRMTPSPRIPIDHRFTDDTAMMYGYISSSNYGIATSGTIPAANPNAAYATRSIIYDDNFNGPSFDSTGSMLRPAVHRTFDEETEMQKQMSEISMHHTEKSQKMRWRDPNLSEVISFLNSPNNIIKANAAAYLQHLCYMDDPNKQRTRSLGGIPSLVRLLSHDAADVHRNACGALRNLSYGRQNDENKRAIQNAGGIGALINLLTRTKESDIKELITGVIWNLSSCEDLKRPIIDDGLNVIVTVIVKPHSGWDQINPGDTCWSTVFRNASGVLRNVSSAGEYARTKLRICDGLIDSILYVIRSAIEKNNIGNKIVENCVCILRNLSYRCQEVEDPNYDKHPLPIQTRTNATTSPTKGENLGCFGGSKKKKDTLPFEHKETSVCSNNMTGAVGRVSLQRNEPIKGYELLWQSEIVQSYLALLQSCSNPETLEAAAGAIQNLAACYWAASIEIRAAVRKEKGLPILVELLRMEVDRVVCAVATALRNLAIDQRNKELIGKYAMRDLVQKLPSGNPQHDQGTSDDTIAAVLATINEVIKKNVEFSRSLLEAGGIERLMNVTRQRQKYTPCVLKFASQVLFTLWQHQELRDVYKKQGWREQDFVTKTVAARNAATNSPNNVNSTLNRPMASQGRTRYEDRTMKRGTSTPNENSIAKNSSGLGSTFQDRDNEGASYNAIDHSYQESQSTSKTTGVKLYSPMLVGNGQPNHSK